MCGGFVVAYSSSKIDTKSSKTTQFISHLFYSLGRISSYVIIGMISGFIGSVISFSATSSGYLFFIIGIFMILMGFSLMGKIRFLTSLESSLGTNPFVKKIFQSLMYSKKIYSFYGLGMLNGFLPCGLVYFFAVSAAATGSIFWGGITMLIFGLTTIPSLLGFGFIIGFFNSGNLREIMIKVASIVIVFYGIYMSYLGYMLVLGNK